MKSCKWLSIVWMVSEICHVLVVADTEILVNEPKGKTWSWYISPHSISDGAGWNSPSAHKIIYSVCDIQSNTEPKNWLRTGFISLKDAKLLEIKIGYNLRNCPDESTIKNCKTYLSIYALHTNKTLSTDDSDPGLVQQYEFVDRITPGVKLKPGETKEFTYHGKFIAKAKGVYLAFLDQGVCIVLQNFTLGYKFCSEKGKDLITFPRTVAPANDSQVEEKDGKCSDSHSVSEGKLSGVCLSSGEWNITDGVKCLCRKGYELVGSAPNNLRCKACSSGTYNDRKGLNCTVIPSEPRHASVLFVNESSAVITWLPPAVTGTQTDLMYDVDCRKSCTYFGKDCDNERCDSDFNALLQNAGGLRITNFAINDLASFVNYTCKISAKNRVSEVAERSPFRAITNFTLVNLRTIGSVPGKPDVTIHVAEDGAIELSWQLSCKNGIIQKYRVVYFKVDDSSDTETLATKETGIRIKSLAPGATFEFRVFAVNNFGTGPPGTKTFKMPSGRLSAKSKIIIGAAAGGGSLLLVIIITVVVFFIFRFRRKPRHRPMQRLGNLQDTQENLPLEAESIHMHHILPEINTDEAENDALYMDICETHTFELERKDIIFERLLGSGNFGEVHKAIIGNNTVAVKSLKENATPKDKDDMITKLNVMESLRPHPHVVKLIGCCSLRDPLLIVLEYLPYGDLLGYLRKSRGHADVYNSGEKTPTSSLSANDLLSFAWMIADGMEYLAKMKIVHRDLAARNILVGENKISKISDFGLARDVSADVYVRTSQARLPVKWMPPESLFHGESSTMSDVWSYGIVLWEVFTIGDSPYPCVEGKNMAALLQRGYRMPRPMHISEELYAIMSECWSEKPEERPSFHWICAAVKRLIDDKKIYINLDYYNDEDYVNFDMIEGLQ